MVKPPPRWRNAARGAASVPAARSFHFSSALAARSHPNSAGLCPPPPPPPLSLLLCFSFGSLSVFPPRHQILLASVTSDPLTSAFVILKAANQLMEGVWGLASC